MGKAPPSFLSFSRKVEKNHSKPPICESIYEAKGAIIWIIKLPKLRKNIKKSCFKCKGLNIEFDVGRFHSRVLPLKIRAIMSFAEAGVINTEKESENTSDIIPNKPVEEPEERPEEELAEELKGSEEDHTCEMKEEPTERLTKGPIEAPAATSTEEPNDEFIEPIAEQETAAEEPAKEPKNEPTDIIVAGRKKNPKKHSFRKIFIISGLLLLFALLAGYLGVASYYNNHFFPGTEINGINVSGKTLNDVKAQMAAKLKNYTLKIKERGDKTERISGKDIGLKYGSDKDYEKFIDSQNGLEWVAECFNSGASKRTVVLKYDKKLLQKQINQLSCFNPDNITEPQNPGFKYTDKSYAIIKETKGNKVNKGILYSRIVKAVRKLKPEIDLESSGCYIKPKYNSNSQKVIDAKNTLNKYVSAKITYMSEDSQITLDGSKINQWLSIDKYYRISINEGKVKAFVNGLSAYKTEDTISFVTSSGDTIKIGGGDFGRTINAEKETQILISLIKDGKTAIKEPEYIQNAFAMDNNGIGNTYVEISLEKQHIWFYKNGSLVVQGDVVTGNIRKKHYTRKGIYALKSKMRNVVLKGPGYAVHVNYWMPFDVGIGIHDANWRSRFGGSIYKTNGTHGCVNAPFNVAKQIFINIEIGTPVICY